MKDKGVVMVKLGFISRFIFIVNDTEECNALKQITKKYNKKRIKKPQSKPNKPTKLYKHESCE